MKKLLAAIAAGLVLIAASQLVSTVRASNKTSSASINRRVAALEAKVRKLQSQMSDVRGNLACDQYVAGVTHVGNPAAGAGFVYTPDNGNTAVLTTALDLTPQGYPPDMWVQLVNGNCVTGAPTHFKVAHIGARMVQRAPFELRSTK